MCTSLVGKSVLFALNQSKWNIQQNLIVAFDFCIYPPIGVAACNHHGTLLLGWWYHGWRWSNNPGLYLLSILVRVGSGEVIPSLGVAWGRWNWPRNMQNSLSLWDDSWPKMWGCQLQLCMFADIAYTALTSLLLYHCIILYSPVHLQHYRATLFWLVLLLMTKKNWNSCRVQFAVACSVWDTSLLCLL